MKKTNYSDDEERYLVSQFSEALTVDYYVNIVRQNRKVIGQNRDVPSSPKHHVVLKSLVESKLRLSMLLELANYLRIKCHVSPAQ